MLPSPLSVNLCPARGLLAPLLVICFALSATLPVLATDGILPPSKLRFAPASDAVLDAKALDAKAIKAKADPKALEDAVSRADGLASAGEWQDAIDTYEWVLSHGFGHAPLLFQLGVCYYRLGKLGKSLFYFKSAQRLRPRDHRIAANVAFIESKTGDAITDTRLLKGVTLPVSDSEWQLTLTACFALIVVLLFGMARLGWPRGAGLATVAVLAVSAAVLWHNRSEAERFAIIVAPIAKVSSGPHPFDVTLFKLKEGTEVTADEEHVNSHGRWWHITLIDGKSGWIAAKNLLTSKKVI